MWLNSAVFGIEEEDYNSVSCVLILDLEPLP